MIRVKRVYETPSPEDGTRVLVDRLWPRGLTKEKAAVDRWMKEVAPSTELRKRFSHTPEKWEEFRRCYAAELDAVPDAVAELHAMADAGTVTLLFGTREERRNNAVALKAYLEGA